MTPVDRGDAPWGVRNTKTGTWTGCPGSALVSHTAAARLEAETSGALVAEPNPADVFAQEIETMPTEKIMARLAG